MEAGEVLVEPVTSKKTSKKQSKNTSTPSKLKVPAAPEASKGPTKQSRYNRYSGLWEIYYDGQTEEGGGEGERGQEGSIKEGESKNIRGFLLKRRKSPLKGWHKRYFVLEGGILCYGRSYTHIQKRKILGSIDLGLAFINCDGNTRRIDIDGEQVYHLKTKNASHFAAWSSCLLSQEMFRKAQLAGGGGMHRSEGGVGQTKEEGIKGWAVKTQETIASVKRDLDAVRDSLEVMSILFKSPLTARPVSTQPSVTELKMAEGSNNSESSSLYSTQSSSDSGGKKSRKSRRKAEKKSKESSVTLSPDQVTQSISPSLSSSHLDDTAEASSPRDDFGSLANTVFNQFCDLVEKLEKLDEDLQEVIKRDNAHHIQQQTIITNQQILLRKAQVQNSDLRDRLTQIQSLAAGVEPVVRMVTPSQRRATPSRALHTGSIPRFDSFLSVHSTISDTFFDALEDVNELSTESEDEVENSETSAGEEEEEEDEELFTSLTTEVLSTLNMTPVSPKQTRLPSISEVKMPPDQPSELGVKRRTKLPYPVVDVGDFSLWSFLRKNIGKDLSKVSMPVTLNEPLSALQRLCEELQYSELLDEAAGLSDVHDRMVRVAAFAVSSYALAYYRAGRKPFNPILGETYEWIREDKGFKFIAEQVSHHPPIAACNCESPNYCFWQDARIKNKFWGKSMEVFPIGTVNVTLPKHDDHYQWKKVTSCIHNVLGGQRWVDQYGELHITNQDKCSCKLTFVKASYWSSKKYEVHGDVYDSDGQKVRHLFGTWHEAMFCGDPANAECIWKAGRFPLERPGDKAGHLLVMNSGVSLTPMPVDHEQYYGFSHYTIGLNDLEEGVREKLPCTDSRFRPDQRLVEEGRIQEAEAEKHRVEQIQREARAERERVGEDWTPNFFRKEEKDGEECWVFMGNYWTHRDNGFTDFKLPKLW